MDESSQSHERAQFLYEEGKKYNWRGPESGANVAVARAAFEQAASLRHPKAMCELADMMFVGSGGAKEQERALQLKFHAARLGEIGALEELSALLGSYAEEQVKPSERSRAELAGKKAEQAGELLHYLASYIAGLSPLSHLSVGQA
jgi:TPR repeat protein